MNSIEAGFIVIASAAAIGALVLVAILGEKGVTIAQALLTLALLFVTGIYARRTAVIARATREQANASVKMAEEMKNTRFAALRPIIEIDWIPGERGHFSPYFKNIGLGPALNVKCYCTHTKFKFKREHDMPTLGVRKREHITLLSEDFDFKEWAGFAINCDYQSIYGENFRSILGFRTEQERNLEISELK